MGCTLANTANITFHCTGSEVLLFLVDKARICASSDSACLADSNEPFLLSKAMKPESAAPRRMIRFSLDAAHSAETAETVLAILE